MAAPKKPGPARDESLDSLKAWWYENGKYFVASALIGLFAAGGWKAWDYNRQMTTREASGLYVALLAQVGDENRTESERLFNDLRDNYAGTPYPALGALSMAKLGVAEDDLFEAVEQLRWAIEHTDQDGLRALAQVRLMRVLLESGDAQAAAAIMEQFSFPRGVEALAAEANGDAMITLGQRNAAIAAYRESLSKLPDNYGFLDMKLQTLGVTPDEEEAPAPSGVSPPPVQPPPAQPSAQQPATQPPPAQPPAQPPPAEPPAQPPATGAPDTAP
ncbi:MAG: tetratricopeptide repeat protein [Gammaproteobacteria bacterium]|nr:tetratricopeptide repeat protein [Gammaproteobacteria bacterium]